MSSRSMDESIEISEDIIQMLKKNNLPIKDDINCIAKSIMLSGKDTIPLIRAV